MNTIVRLETERRPYVAAAGLVLTAWLLLGVWSLSPYAEWLDHAQMEHIAAPAAVRLAVFALGWALMIVAMMLPGTLLLLARCRPAERSSLPQLAPVIAAYLVPWLAFGVFSYLGDSALHEVVEQRPALAGVIAPGVLLLAGGYQFTPLKRACLARCRTWNMPPSGGEQAHVGDGWVAGLRHGLACLGSCWALMLLMFAFGGMNPLWMLALGSVMTAERLARPHFPLSPLLGGLLILLATVLLT
jgi:predicted metal-binding membrane protein